VPGAPPDFGRPPDGTHYQLVVSQVTGDGRTFLFPVGAFEVRPVVDPASPCFIEDDESRFPGLHVTRYAERLSAETGVADPFDPPAGASEGDVVDVLTARRRMSNLSLLRASIKAVTSQSPAAYPAPAADCAGPDGEIPPPECTDDASNARRQRLCEAFWAEHPTLYEGSDKVFTLPLNGAWHGAVDGTDPRTGQPIGGANFLVAPDLTAAAALLVTWQFDCAPDDFAARGDDCAPVYPPGTPVEQQTALGVTYLVGTLAPVTRGVLSGQLENPTFSSISGHVSIIADLDGDEEHF
jgi:hypothetical protein